MGGVVLSPRQSPGPDFEILREIRHIVISFAIQMNYAMLFTL